MYYDHNEIETSLLKKLYTYITYDVLNTKLSINVIINNNSNNMYLNEKSFIVNNNNIDNNNISNNNYGININNYNINIYDYIYRNIKKNDWSIISNENDAEYSIDHNKNLSKVLNLMNSFNSKNSDENINSKNSNGRIEEYEIIYNEFLSKYEEFINLNDKKCICTRVCIIKIKIEYILQFDKIYEMCLIENKNNKRIIVEFINKLNKIGNVHYIVDIFINIIQGKIMYNSHIELFQYIPKEKIHLNKNTSMNNIMLDQYQNNIHLLYDISEYNLDNDRFYEYLKKNIDYCTYINNDDLLNNIHKEYITYLSKIERKQFISCDKKINNTCVHSVYINNDVDDTIIDDNFLIKYYREKHESTDTYIHKNYINVIYLQENQNFYSDKNKNNYKSSIHDINKYIIQTDHYMLYIFINEYIYNKKIELKYVYLKTYGDVENLYFCINVGLYNFLIDSKFLINNNINSTFIYINSIINKNDSYGGSINKFIKSEQDNYRFEYSHDYIENLESNELKQEMESLLYKTFNIHINNDEQYENLDLYNTVCVYFKKLYSDQNFEELDKFDKQIEYLKYKQLTCFFNNIEISTFTTNSESEILISGINLINIIYKVYLYVSGLKLFKIIEEVTMSNVIDQKNENV